MFAFCAIINSSHHANETQPPLATKLLNTYRLSQFLFPLLSLHYSLRSIFHLCCADIGEDQVICILRFGSAYMFVVSSPQVADYPFLTDNIKLFIVAAIS